MEFFKGLRRTPRNSTEKPTQENIHSRRELENAFQEYIKHLPLTKDDLQKPLLDIGAGDGAFIGYLRRVLGNTRAFGVEKDARKIRPGQEGMAVADGLHLPFANGAFDIVIGKEYFQMFVENEREMQQAIAEALRVLKPGGKMLGSIATPESATVDLKRLPRRTRGEDVFRAKKKVEGAKKLEVFLQELQKDGYKVEYGESKHWSNWFLKAPIVTIHKL